MSAYHSIVNHSRWERIDPLQIGDSTLGWGSVAFGDASRILAFMMADVWRGDHVAIMNDDLDPPKTLEKIARYTDVTAAALQAWNAKRPKGLRPIACYSFDDAADLVVRGRGA